MKQYPSDLTDDQWELISSLIPQSKPGGRPRITSTRLVVDALLYINRTGCQWRIFRKASFQQALEIVKRPTKEFQVVRWRWIVERTFGWLNKYSKVEQRL